ncbi:TLR4 interactor with leucine rich repeats [Drosophila guanche]|uniref:Blast:Leucine-rich repeats and immunoglobulin-like domains protein 1 n=1 Tax=Drosophila guanche TaxID=7266 RepID=A0A3B0JEV0_DROGU|nr:TLR4 interactor with leucine rich repeats [Drosophila guanche]SPP73820.1 blast:Leucine-rich repeats and immunoglobulin-like domains protein 1 [Drosophila guanche]
MAHYLRTLSATSKMWPKLSLLVLLLCLAVSALTEANELKDLLEDATTSTTAATTSSSVPALSTSTATTPTAYVVSAAAVPVAATTTGKSRSKSSAVKYFNKGTPKKRKAEQVSSLPLPVDDGLMEWKCPNITSSRNAELECGCDLPHTLRCNIDLHGLLLLADRLRTSPYSVSLLDCSLRNVTFLSDAKIFDGVSLHGLVISSGEIKRVHKSAFLGIKGPLQALGLPGNALLSVPWNALSTLGALERLDLANNKIKALGTADFVGLSNLVYLELSSNQISSISQRTFSNLRKLEVLKLGGNRLGDYAQSLRSLSQCLSLRQLDLTANNLNGPLSAQTLAGMRNLESLNLNRNMIKSIQNKALANFSRLVSLSLRHNQIDVLQDHAFYGLGALDSLDLSYNGIVAISSSSLQHLSRLTVLDLTHNFLRALTSDLIAPLPSLRELRLAGNDISIVARNAMDGARELQSLQMQDNPLSCDCSIRPFAEWLQVSQLHSSLTASCVTPPRLEGAPLLQVPVETLSCDMDNVEKDNANIMQHLETLAKPNQTSPVRDLSEEIILHDLHYSNDYGLILTWLLNLSKKDYMCDAIFVYKEENINEILIDNSPIHCESKVVNGQNTVSVIVPDSSSLDIGKSYRFCLVMVEEQNPQADLNIGCSNITQLQLSSPGSIPVSRQYQRRPYYTPNELKTDSQEQAASGDYQHNQRQFNSLAGSQQQQTHPHQQSTLLHSYTVIDSLNKSFLPGLGLGVLVTSVLVLIWGATRLRQSSGVNGSGAAADRSRSSGSCSGSAGSNSGSIHNNNNNSRPGTPTATTCYAASDHIARLADAESGTRYLKLQATTSL